MELEITKETIEKILPDWHVHAYPDGSFDLSAHSPAGEDVLVTLVGDTAGQMADYVERTYDDFDPQDHAAQIYHEKKYGTPEERAFYAAAPEDLNDLIDDALAIDKMFYSVAQALRNLEKDAEDGEREDV